jgi:cytoskeletal protein CcmA (bactofilin family)
VQSGCVIAGSVVGNIAQAPGAQVHVTVTETGDVRGDIKAHQIIVMGRTQGLLDASAGLVTLHESANVQGHVRYAKLQVNGAELNATLEKSTPTTSNGR